MRSPYVLDLREIDRTHVNVAGGKGANLGELSRVEGIRVPRGFSITTQAFGRVIAESSGVGDLLDQVARLKAEEQDPIRALGAELRRAVGAIAIPHDVATAITEALTRLGDDAAFAVRSSATAEDMPT